MERLEFTTEINAPVDKVFNTMFAPETYKQWTAVFSPTSAYEGEWAQDAKILFTMLDNDGKRGGMIGIVEQYVPDKMVSVRFIGVLDGDNEITEGDVIQSFVGNYENYYFESLNHGTSVRVEVDVDAKYRSYMLETYPRSLTILKQITEADENLR